ncbi:MAG: hypothetical protein AB8U78_02420 [Rickettsia slovaca]|uniref:Uncharacterized protein n=2 Tax=Rickettsia slovaca TaxID=35794 RepID=H8LN00_RICSL|nr:MULTISPECIES: hypothetical protein [spotted fever group]AEV92782.1 hypothetical protein Rsl_1523 [Rickettsia slovaca 13-B]AFD20316.1 hypothetical protein MC3_07405 [Rickettsia slovaca str. D-CWPP]
MKNFLETGKKELTEEQKEKLDKLNDMITPSLKDKIGIKRY